MSGLITLANETILYQQKIIHLLRKTLKITIEKVKKAESSENEFRSTVESRNYCEKRY